MKYRVQEFRDGKIAGPVRTIIAQSEVEAALAVVKDCELLEAGKSTDLRARVRRAGFMGTEYLFYARVR